MRSAKALLLLLIILCSLFLLCGCWNYRDIEKALLVSGFSIDKNDQGDKYLITIEIIETQTSGKDAKQTVKFVESQGNTIFDAIRNSISLTGKRLYWAHANVMVISSKIAKEGITPVLDFLIRDAEMREEIYLLISTEKTAKELLMQQMPLSNSSADNLQDIITNQASAGNAPTIRAFEFIDTLQDEGVSAFLPAGHLTENCGINTGIIEGSAIFKSDKLVGYLNPEDTKTLLFITNKFQKGLLTLKENTPANGMDNVTFEVLRSKTKIKPVLSQKNVTMKIDISMNVAIAELATTKNYVEDDKLRNKLVKDEEEKLKASVLELISKVQSACNSDVFGFGKHIKASMPGLWKSSIKNNKNYLKDLKYDINVKITIKNSALTLKPLQKGD
jgi:spore germination protein KC